MSMFSPHVSVCIYDCGMSRGRVCNCAPSFLEEHTYTHVPTHSAVIYTHGNIWRKHAKEHIIHSCTHRLQKKKPVRTADVMKAIGSSTARVITSAVSPELMLGAVYAAECIYICICGLGTTLERRSRGAKTS